MSEQSCKQIELVADQGSHGHIAHLALRLQLAKDAFLRSATIMEGHERFGLQLFVRHHDLEVVAGFIRDEQIQLHRPLLPPLHFRADEDKAKTLVPFLGFPSAFEIGRLAVDTPPSFACFHHAFELNETLEGNGHAEFNSLLIQGRDDLIAEEGAVHSHLDLCVGEDLPKCRNAGQNERPGPS